MSFSSKASGVTCAQLQLHDLNMCICVKLGFLALGIYKNFPHFRYNRLGFGTDRVEQKKLLAAMLQKSFCFHIGRYLEKRPNVGPFFALFKSQLFGTVIQTLDPARKLKVVWTCDRLLQQEKIK